MGPYIKTAVNCFACLLYTSRNGVLIVFSLFFYAWGEPVWVTLLIFSATIDYFHGRICERYAGHWQAKAALVSSLVLNLGLLGVFKYSGMLVESVNSLTGLSLPVPAFSLPIGISFYTFQTISYVIDVYRGQARAQRSYWRFFMYEMCIRDRPSADLLNRSRFRHSGCSRQILSFGNRRQ